MGRPYRTAAYYRRRAEKKIDSIVTGNETAGQTMELMEKYLKDKEACEEAYEVARAEYEALCNKLVPF